MLWGLILFALAQLADVWTTERVLAAGGREENPVIRFFMDRLGRGWIIAKLGLAAGVAWIAVRTGEPLLPWVAGAVTAYVAHRNWRLLR
ncbi:DUF5658 family protein [Salipiger sp. PrR007]|uniref:DUF5658 family protein n=1 Tax=Salipiger sp. PrR007 TaxID=2706884 RepID=UPI0013B61454|nr:DUF5658 family protein [Salipiger sp. PrR007]NDW32947.1 hypothetical protein [Salipiger sp. PrR007]